jgi:hypothetical protein
MKLEDIRAGQTYLVHVEGHLYLSMVYIQGYIPNEGWKGWDQTHNQPVLIHSSHRIVKAWPLPSDQPAQAPCYH